MARGLILGQLEPDTACAVALALVEMPRVVVSLEAVTLHDAHMRPLGTARDWLTDDPLDAAVRDYLRAKREANMTTARRPNQPPWVAAAAVKTRDQATHRALAARDAGRLLLEERGFFAKARKAGLKVIGVD